MAERNRATNLIIQGVLALVIIGLAYFLYLSITEPYKVIEAEQEMTERTRERMRNVRTALINFERREGRFPHTLDTLHTYVLQDSFMVAGRDSIFGPEVNVDSLIYSPRTGRQFEYTVNDTAAVAIYLLEDPDSRDHIGSARPDITRVNAASWE
jgi:hypothetical protein